MCIVASDVEVLFWLRYIDIACMSGAREQAFLKYIKLLSSFSAIAKESEIESKVDWHCTSGFPTN